MFAAVVLASLIRPVIRIAAVAANSKIAITSAEFLDDWLGEFGRYFFFAFALLLVIDPVRRLGPAAGARRLAAVALATLVAAAVAASLRMGWWLLRDDSTAMPALAKLAYPWLQQFTRNLALGSLLTAVEEFYRNETICLESTRAAEADRTALDQGIQFSSADFVAEVQRIGARQSMDGKGCWRDNVFVKWLWRSVKYEDVYLKAYEAVSAARQSLATYFEFYNARRPHQSHDGRTPDMVYFNSLPPMQAAA